MFLDRRINILFLAILSLAGCVNNDNIHGNNTGNNHSKITVADQRPNIIVIMADDLGWSDIGSYGSEIQTPHLDKLAQQGLRFTQFHNTSKCFPTRASLLTGQYAQSVGYDKTSNTPLINDATLGDVLKAAGYTTLMVGKHHGIDNPHDLGFDHYRGLRSGASNHFNPGYQRHDEKQPAQKKPQQRTWCFDEKCITPYTPENKHFYSTDAFTDWSLELLRDYQQDSKPFFLYLSYTAPHDPLQAWPEDIDKYRDIYTVGYEEIANARYHRFQHSELIDKSYPRSPPTYRQWQQLSEQEKHDQALRMAVYAAMVDRLDQNIGRLIQYLRDSKQLHNTLIVFTSDNGSSAEEIDLGNGRIGDIDRWSSLGPDWANVGNMPFRMFKNYSYQGGITSPFIAHWPLGLKGNNRVTDFSAHVIDLMATFVDVTKAEYPQHIRGESIPAMAGNSLLPVFQGQQLQRQSPLFFLWQHGRAVREGRWKLVSWDNPVIADEDIADDGQYELYDMQLDKTETQDLAVHYPKQVVRLKELFNRWYQQISENTNTPVEQ